MKFPTLVLLADFYKSHMIKSPVGVEEVFPIWMAPQRGHFCCI